MIYKIEDDYQAIVAYDCSGKELFFYELKQYRGVDELVEDLNKFEKMRKQLTKLKENIREFDNGMWPDDIERIIKEVEETK